MFVCHLRILNSRFMYFKTSVITVQLNTLTYIVHDKLNLKVSDPGQHKFVELQSTLS